jgi:hypothetical protein
MREPKFERAEKMCSENLIGIRGDVNARGRSGAVEHPLVVFETLFVEPLASEGSMHFSCCPDEKWKQSQKGYSPQAHPAKFRRNDCEDDKSCPQDGTGHCRNESSEEEPLHFQHPSPRPMHLTDPG